MQAKGRKIGDEGVVLERDFSRFTTCIQHVDLTALARPLEGARRDRSSSASHWRWKHCLCLALSPTQLTPVHIC